MNARVIRDTTRKGHLRTLSGSRLGQPRNQPDRHRRLDTSVCSVRVGYTLRDKAGPIVPNTGLGRAWAKVRGGDKPSN